MEEAGKILVKIISQVHGYLEKYEGNPKDDSVEVLTEKLEVITSILNNLCEVQVAIGLESLNVSWEKIKKEWEKIWEEAQGEHE